MQRKIADYNDIQIMFLKSVEELMADIKQNIKYRQKIKHADEQITHDTLRMVQKWFNLRGNIGV